MKAIEAMDQRISVRRYEAKSLSDEIRAKVKQLCEGIHSGPFGVSVHFNLVDFKPLNSEELRKLGTYGMIKGADCYLLGVVQETEGGLEDLGYCLEKIIITLTAMGLGTCWLGGTFKRSAFAKQIDLAEDEMLPAITPIGYPRKSLSVFDRSAQSRTGLHKRKPFGDLFFDLEAENPLSVENAGPFYPALEAVRIAPSASNRQPWRIIKDQEGCFHLYLKENKLYNRIMGKYRIQNIDMGIAMAHFELAAKELELPGRWVINAEQAPLIDNMKYVQSWIV